ncbi:MFS transporter [Kocuria sp. LUK]|uniref:MFS transporter n=1 Tax=Kocuria flava TaxID=446860 RepID=A0A2N4T3F3_9MICC|nr:MULTISPECIES: MFS transporter [Kocuria]MCD1143842.1 MFS transporter [Kocuria sp. LUK]PLC12755.1 MFS transporter [Kocuria flava]
MPDVPPPAPRPRRPVPRAGLLLVCIGLVALVLRTPIVAVAPVLGQLRDELGITAAQAGLLTTVPVLCFAVASPLASLAIRRLGVEFAITATLVGVLAGVLVRSAGGVGAALAGTVVIGLAITVGNIAVPLLIRRDFPPHRHSAATGLYTAALNIGSTLAAVLTAPLAEAAGWRLALAASASAVLAGVVVWWLTAGRRAVVPGAVSRPAPAGRAPAGGRWAAAGLAAGFSGQAFAYYGVTAWLPSLLGDTVGMTVVGAGAASSFFQVFAIAGGLGVPLAARRFSTARVAAAIGVLWLSLPVGLLLAPAQWWAWTALGGVAQGGGITVIFVAIMQLARDNASAGRISAVVQSVGYGFGALAPTVVGAVQARTGSWTAALLVVLAATAAYLLGTTLSVRAIARRGRDR